MPLGQDNGALVIRERRRSRLVDLERQEAPGHIRHEPAEAEMRERQDTVRRHLPAGSSKVPRAAAAPERRHGRAAMDMGAGPHGCGGEATHIGERVEPPAGSR